MRHTSSTAFIQCCRLTSADVSDLAALERLCFTLPWNEEQYAAAFNQRPFACFGLKLQGRLLAYVAIYATETDIEILNIAVAPDQRRQGLGRRLLRLVLRLATKMGIVNAVLEVRPSNTAALTLYQRAGFIVAGRRRGYYHDTNEDALVMTLVLSCPSSVRAD